MLFLKAPTEKCTFSTTTKIFLIFFIVSDLFIFIYFRDSTYIFKLWHFFLDYITEHLKLVFNYHMNCYNIKQGHMKVLTRVSALLLMQTYFHITKWLVTEVDSPEYVRY